MIKVAIDAGPLTSGHKVRGVGFYTKELVKALGQGSKRVKGLKVEAVNVEMADLSKYDLIHIPYFNPFLLSFPENISDYNFVVTIHDLIPLVYPKHYQPGVRGKLTFLKQKTILKKAKAIITDSETSKKDIVRFLGINPNKIYVIRLAQGEIFKKISDTSLLYSIEVKYKLPKKFVLYVGDINYNKNIPNLIAACKIAKMPLVICGKQALEIEELGQNLKILKGPRDWIRYVFGKPHPELAHYKELLRKFKGNKNIIRLGFVPDEDLVAIYNLAEVYCQPSLYEGFGLPVLEAFACGTPIVASKTQALVELSEGAAVFVDPNDPKDIAEGFKKRIKNPKLPREYAWEKTAKETYAIYQKCLRK